MIDLILAAALSYAVIIPDSIYAPAIPPEVDRGSNYIYIEYYGSRVHVFMRHNGHEDVIPFHNSEEANDYADWIIESGFLENKIEF
jgi:hypothetical protein